MRSEPPPTPASVYRLFGADDEFLYAGCSTEPVARIRTHAGNKPWWHEVEFALFEHFDSKEEAFSRESFYIRRFKPKYNHQPGRRAKRPADPHLAAVEEKAA